jgi:hypothetical protein
VKMKNNRVIRDGILMFIPIMGLAVQDAHAYLDPGTGSLIIQAIVGVFLAGSMTFKLWYYRVKEFFIGKSATPNDDEVDEE